MENDGWLSAWSEPNVELVYQHTGERHLPKCPFVIEYGWAKRIACTCPHVVGVDDSYDKLQITIDTLTAERDRYREALERANLALIEARNPGIDMEAVKRQRSAALAPNTEGEGT